MAVLRRSVGASAAGTTSVTVAQPTSPAPSTGDLLVAFIIDHATTGNSAAPTGWTRQGGAAGTGGRFQVFTAVVGSGGLTGTSWSFTGLTTRSQGVIAAYYQNDPATLLDVAVSARINASGTTGTTSITTVTDNARIIAAFAALASGSTWSAEALATSPTVTEFFDAANSTFCSIALADGDKATAGATGASSATMGTAGANAGIIVAIRPAVAPTVTTQAVSSVADVSATGNGNVTADGGMPITERGTVINTTGTPTTADHKDTASGTTGAYTTSLTALLPNTTYYVRAYAINAIGTSYGTQVSFTTNESPIRLAASSNIAAGGTTNTTAQLNAPSGKTTANFTAGKISDDTNPLPAVDIASGGYTELEWSLQVMPVASANDVYQFRVTNNGVALDTYTVTPQVTVSGGASAAFAGAGTFSAGTPQFNTSVTIAGVAVLVGGTPRFNASASFAGTSALSAAPVFNASVSSAGVGALSTNPGVTSQGSDTLAGTSTLSPGSPQFNSSATLAGTATLAIGTVLFRESAAIAGTGVLTATPVFNAGSVTSAGTSTLAATPVFNSSVSIVGAGVLSPGSPRFNASAPVAGVGTLAASNAQFIASASIAGVGVLTEGHQYSGPAGAAIDGTSTLVATPLLITPAAANFVATGTLAAQGSVTAVGSATLAGTGILAANASGSVDRSIAFVGAGVLTAIPTITNIASFNAASIGTFSATPRITNVSTVTIIGVATVQASAAVTQPASAAFVGTGTFTAAYQYGVYVSASAAFAGAGALSISSYGYYDALPAWAGTSIGLTAYAETSVSLTAFVETDIQPTAYAAGSVRVA